MFSVSALQADHFAIVLECLTNAGAHACYFAAQTKVQLQRGVACDDRNASVRVEDQGPRDLDGVFCDGASEPRLLGGG